MRQALDSRPSRTAGPGLPYLTIGRDVLRDAFVIAAIGLAAASQAALKQDVLNFTNNIPAKMIWVRSTGKASEDLYNTGTSAKLMCYDTDVDAERVLHDTAGQHIYPFITRSGDYAIWSDHAKRKSFSIRWDGTQKKTVLSGDIFHAICSHWDEVARKEYLYALGSMTGGELYVQGQKIYRYELTSGAVDLATQSLVVDLTTSYWATTLAGNLGDRWARVMPGLVSGDGKYLAANQPWPRIYANDLTANTGYRISNTSDQQACWPQIAPDKSNRFFHLDQDHRSFHMYDRYTDNVSSARWIRVSDFLPGIYGEFKDIVAPRWSNHITFFAVGYPLTRATPTAEFCIGKFNDAFTSIAALKITNGAATNNRDKVGDLWLRSGEGPNKNTGTVTTLRQIRNIRPRIGVAAGFRTIEVSFGATGPVLAVLLNASGQAVAKYSGSGIRDWSIGTGMMEPGLYVVQVASDGHRTSRTLILSR